MLERIVLCTVRTKISGVAVEYAQTDKLLSELGPKSNDESLPVQTLEDRLHRDCVLALSSVSLLLHSVLVDFEFSVDVVAWYTLLELCESGSCLFELASRDEPPRRFGQDEVDDGEETDRTPLSVNRDTETGRVRLVDHLESDRRHECSRDEPAEGQRNPAKLLEDLTKYMLV